MLEFLIDSGATRSSIDTSAATGCTVLGMVAVGGIGGHQQQAFLLGGGQMTFDAEDAATGQTVAVAHTGPVLLAGALLIGQEVIQQLQLDFGINYSVKPASVHLRR